MKLEELKMWYKELPDEWKAILFGDIYENISNEDLSKILTLEQLTVSEPSVGTLHITSIEPVKVLKKLKKIDLNETSVEDLSPLSELYELEEISCEQTNQPDLLDLTPLKDLNKLKKVSFFKAGVTNLSALNNKPSLKFACFCESGTSDYERKAFFKGNPHCEVCGCNDNIESKNTMQDFQTIKKQAEDLRNARNFEQALPLYKQLWEEYKENCTKWEAWGYAFCLKQLKHYAQALEICREIYPQNKDFEHIKGVYAWCVYYTEIAVEKVNDEPKFFKAGEGILKLSKQEDKYSPYILTVFKILEYLNKKNLYPTDQILHWTSKLNPDFLDATPYAFTDNDGKTRELASKKEQYFSWRTKALFRKELYQECIDLCETALHSFEKFHYDNDSWFKFKIALSTKHGLKESDNALNQLKEILKKKKEWFIQKEIAEILFEQGNLEEAKKYLIEACLNFGEAKNKVNLYVFFAKVLIAQNQTEQAKKHIEFAYYVRVANEFKIDVELQDLANQYQIDTTKTVNLKDFERELKPLWNKLKFEGKESLLGVINKIMPHGKAGFVKTETGKSYYFKITKFLEKQKWVKEQQKVSFFLEDTIKPDGTPTQNAINIELSKK